MKLGRMAILGSGIAGMSAAYFLKDHADLTVFEKDDRIGGHTHTIDCEGQSFDTGFMVYNEVTYPLLTALFKKLQVPTQPTSMSFSVQVAKSGLEYCGSSLNHLFAQRRNLINPKFWRLLLRINRFNQEAFNLLSRPEANTLSLGDFIARHDFGQDFLDEFLIPMSSAVWSTPKDKMLDFPAHTLIRFFHNHGFLGLHTQHPWRTVTGGSRSYRDRLIAPFKDRIHTRSGVARVERTSDGKTRIRTLDGTESVFDRVILACHADEVLSLLADPTPRERALLAPFKYQSNPTVVHTDDSVMPRKRLAWSSWNYRIERDGSGSTHYWMNELQAIRHPKNYIVSLNLPDPEAGGRGAIDPQKILKHISYTHPIFSLEAIQAQEELPLLNRDGDSTGRYYCGSYFKYGFHEDALRSSVTLCEQIIPGSTG